MKEWIRKFFAVDNTVNENTVMGVVYSTALLVAVFVKPLEIDLATIGVLAAAMTAFFGLTLGKK